jgi:short-chain fatty acids transporter
MTPALEKETDTKQNPLGRMAWVFTYLFEKALPDPYVFALILTFVAVGLALRMAPSGTIQTIASSWYGGFSSIFSFAFQMVMMLTTGYALAKAPLIERGLTKLAAVPRQPESAVSLTLFVSLSASWLNWGLGLVISALLARAIARRIEIDFGWLVAAAYSGFVVSTEGLSGSIALSQATHASPLNIVEKVTGNSIPLPQMIFARFNVVPVVLLFIALPILFRYVRPTAANVQIANSPATKEGEIARSAAPKGGIGKSLDQAWVLNVALVLLATFSLGVEWMHKGFSLDLNSVILSLLILGLLLHWRPVAYVEAIRDAARVSGPLILQYPLYGGLMGIMTGTGLAEVIAKAFIRVATGHTLPFFTYLASLVITFFVPSGGGHWAVQGPFAVLAARDLHASMAATTMSVAMGESVANMIQPFWALPILAIAGIPMRRMMGFMVITFFVSLIVFGASLLMLV